MYITRFDHAAAFARLAVPVLQQHEAENNLALGIISSLVASDRRDVDPFLAVVCRTADVSADAIAAIVLRTPPFPVIVAFTPGASDPAAAACLADELHTLYGNDITGFNADTRIVDPYVDSWAALTGTRATVHMRLRIYRCSHVTPPRSVPGTARPVEPRDRDVVRTLITGFYQDAVPDEYDPERVERYIDRMMTADPAHQGLLLWEAESEVVSMAAYTGPTPHGMRVSAVYTPGPFRRRGYASACVAELSRRLLSGGRDFCFLFTDLSNPTSNKIYQEIGYEPVSDHVFWKFDTSSSIHGSIPMERSRESRSTISCRGSCSSG